MQPESLTYIVHEMTDGTEHPSDARCAGRCGRSAWAIVRLLHMRVVDLGAEATAVARADTPAVRLCRGQHSSSLTAHHPAARPDCAQGSAQANISPGVTTS
jgi:hypothetical protein